MTKGTQWTIKTPRLRCKCGRVVHFQCKGRWSIIYDSEPQGVNNDDRRSDTECEAGEA